METNAENKRLNFSRTSKMRTNGNTATLIMPAIRSGTTIGFRTYNENTTPIKKSKFIVWDWVLVDIIA